MKDLAREFGKEIVFSRTIIACCPDEIMKRSLQIYGKKISKGEALIVLSCAAGIKSAFLTNPDIPVINLLDSVGSVPVTRSEHPAALSICKNCGQCVIAYTGGICPVSACPVKNKYEPCKKYPENGIQCAIDPELECVWKEIEKRGDLTALKELREIHKAGEGERITPVKQKPLNLWKAIFGWFAAHIQSLERIIRPFR